MNPQIKEKWVKALRSGDYKQGQGLLRSGDKFCCLGVLCDIYAKENPNQTIMTGEHFGYQVMLPLEVRQWAELRYQYGDVVDIDGAHNTLSKHNDINHATFEQIADAIESQL